VDVDYRPNHINLFFSIFLFHCSLLISIALWFFFMVWESLANVSIRSKCGPMNSFSLSLTLWLKKKKKKKKKKKRVNSRVKISNYFWNVREKYRWDVIFSRYTSLSFVLNFLCRTVEYSRIFLFMLVFHVKLLTEAGSSVTSTS
jgi:hypothetical protein